MCNWVVFDLFICEVVDELLDELRIGVFSIDDVSGCSVVFHVFSCEHLAELNLEVLDLVGGILHCDDLRRLFHSLFNFFIDLVSAVRFAAA